MTAVEVGAAAPVAGAALDPDLVRVVGERPARWRPRLPRWARRCLGILVLPIVWELILVFGIVEERHLASPADVASTALDLIGNGVLADHLLTSLQRVAFGVTLGIVVGVGLALVAGLFRLGEDLVDPTMQMLRTVPVLALVPLFLIWFGIGEAPKIAMVAAATAFPMYLNVLAGIRSVDGRVVEAARMLGLGNVRLALHIILPGALPGALVGLRYSLGVAWLVLVFAETINATSGIGYLVFRARDFMQTDVILVGACVYALLGFGTDLLVRGLQRSLLSWRRGFDGA